MTTATPKRPRYFAVSEIPHSNLAPEDSVQVLAFSSEADRRAWVDDPDDEYTGDPMTAGGVRQAVSRAYAARTMRDIMESIYGGRQSGHEALREVAVSCLEGLRR